MFSTILQELKGYFGRDYLLGVFFPILIFISLSLAVFFEITRGLGNAISRWERLSLSAQVLIIAGGFIGVSVAAYLIYNFQYLITRFYEGYWLRVPILKWLRQPRSDFHRGYLTYLDELKEQLTELLNQPLTDKVQERSIITLINEISAEKLAYYPPLGHEHEVMPTRIGNILRASEIHAYDRYQIDSSIIWTRLRPLLPAEVVAALEDKKTARDFSLLMALLAAAFTLIWCPLLAIFTDRWGIFLICAAGWPLALISYRNAVESTLAYAEQVKATFDVNRHLLLKALNREPKTLEAERQDWKNLSRFFYRNMSIPPEEAKPEVGWDRVATALARCLEQEYPPGADGK
jgi:hypothetical protein